MGKYDRMQKRKEQRRAEREKERQNKEEKFLIFKDWVLMAEFLRHRC